MKRFFPYLALMTIMVLVGCAGDSPSPRSVPTVTPDTWNITALESSSSGPFVDIVILIEATVTRNGSPAPDDTVVVFNATGGSFSSRTLEANVLTEDGVASVDFVATEAGVIRITARVGNVERQISVTYRDRAASDELQLYGIDPRRGSYAGGDEVQITGKGILAPVDAYFDLNGVSYQAIVAAVTESDPPSEDGSVTVITPAFTGAETNLQQAADVRVVTNAGTGSQDTATLPQAYVLVPGGGPAIYGLSPNSGRSSGGEIVNILGQGFGSVPTDISVSFTDIDDTVRVGTVVAVAPDGSQIQAETPLFSTLPLTEDRPQDVSVSTLDGTARLEDGFIVLADNPQPIITSISPIAGPIEGGTLVTIFGKGFQIPMQVFFGGLEATDVNVFNDTTPADQDRITCLSPDYSQQGGTPPIAVEVTVTNSNSGASDSYASFNYGDPLFITGNAPQEGVAGDLVIIYGSGFSDPLQVFFPGEGGTQLEVVSVSGTELVVRIPDSFGTQCTISSGVFTVVMLETGATVSGGNFTVRGNSPFVLSVDPILFEEEDPGGSLGGGFLDPDTLSITGLDFAPEALVKVQNYSVPLADLSVESPTLIEVDLANVRVFDIIPEFAQGPCTTAGGDPGVRNEPTPVDVAVINYPGACESTLNAAFYIEPFDQQCIAGPANLSSSPREFGQTYFFADFAQGSCNAGEVLALTVENVGGQNATINSVDVSGTIDPLDFQVVSESCSGVVLTPGDSCPISVAFCPQGLLGRTGAATVDYDDGVAASVIKSVNLVGNGL